MTTKVSEKVARKRRFIPITSFFGSLGSSFNHAWEAVKPGPVAWKGAALGLLVAALLTIRWASYRVFQTPPRIVSILTGSVQFIAIAAIAAGLLVLLVALLNRIPTFYGWALIVMVVLLYVSFFIEGFPSPPGIAAVMLSVAVVMSLLGGAAWILVRMGWRNVTGSQRVITALSLLFGLAGLIAGVSWLFGAGPAVKSPANAAAMARAQVTPLAMPDPSQPGQYKVQTLTYGTGQDKNRPEYSSDVDLVTGSVDGSPFIGLEWSSGRTRFWGFGPDALPINGRVWYPGGEGPFSLALIVHGDHPMYKYSEPGYDYLGELLASRGFILVSVDANFLIEPGGDGWPG
ncbi:MAG TPA: hypothetical protein VF177_04885 [Anaerolineae bacterium]